MSRRPPGGLALTDRTDSDAPEVDTDADQGTEEDTGQGATTDTGQKEEIKEWNPTEIWADAGWDHAYSADHPEDPDPLVVEDLDIYGGLLTGAYIHQWPNDLPNYPSVTVNRVRVQANPKTGDGWAQGAYIVDFDELTIDGFMALADHRIGTIGDSRPSQYIHPLYIITGDENLGADITIRNSVFKGPWYGVKVRADVENGNDTVIIEDSILIDNMEAVGLKPDANVSRPNKNVIIRNCVILWTEEYREWIDHLDAEGEITSGVGKLVRLYKADSFTFENNVTIGTWSSASPDSSDWFAHSSLDGLTVNVSGNRHRDEPVSAEELVLPANPYEVPAALESLRALVP